MKLTFYKYQGTGNDFILVDNRLFKIGKNDTKKIAHWCNRKFGIGADGFILLENHPKYDFRMVYFNADGNESTMCGNGGRCMTSFAKFLKIIDNKATFEAIDGLHEAEINNGIVSLKMQDVNQVEAHKNFTFLDTGSPHHVEIQEDIENLNVKKEGSKIRFSDMYKAHGCNVNFVAPTAFLNTFKVRTYERGVEDETFSCGTGVTAVAISMNAVKRTNGQHIKLQTLGGDLEVKFEVNDGKYSNIWLIGPAEQVFKGEIEW